jgi:hypothetical protein
MANFTYTRPGGVWATDTDLLPSELADLDLKTTNAVSGDGGTYYLDDPLVLGGSGTAFFEVGVEAKFLDDATFANDTFLNGTVYVYGSIGFYAPAYFENEANFDGNLWANGFTFLEGPVQVHGQVGFFSAVVFDAGTDPVFAAPATFNAAVDINSSVDVSGGLTVAGPLVATNSAVFTGVTGLYGAVDLRKTLTMSSTGSIAHRVVAGDDTTTSYSPLAVHEVVMESGVLSGSTDWYINDSGCTDGNEILFGNKDGAASITVRRPGGSSIIDLTNKWVRCVRIAGVWQKTQQGTYS